MGHISFRAIALTHRTQIVCFSSIVYNSEPWYKTRHVTRPINTIYSGHYEITNVPNIAYFSDFEEDQRDDAVVREM